MLNADIPAAIRALKQGKIIVYPTDTLYGLGADIYNESAIKKVFSIKKRPDNMPLSIAVSDYDEIINNSYVNSTAEILIKSFLPGKLTLILKKKKKISDQITGGLNKVAIRIPDNKIALGVLSKFGPLTATSANIHGNKTPFIISDIVMQFKKNDISVFLDDGKIAGKPSTIVDVSDNEVKILRKGAISNNDILEAVKNG
jgi:L-threonylcarbamoyladenylate synthase